MAVLGLVDVGDVVEGVGDVEVLGPEGLAVDRQRALVGREGLVGAKQASSKIAKMCGAKLQSLIPRANVRVEVEPEGTVARATVLPPLKGTPEAACIEEAIVDLRFPATRDGATFEWNLTLY